MASKHRCCYMCVYFTLDLFMVIDTFCPFKSFKMSALFIVSSAYANTHIHTHIEEIEKERSGYRRDDEGIQVRKLQIFMSF